MIASQLYQAVLLWYRDEGYSPAEIARREGVSIRTVQVGLKRAREAEDDLAAREFAPNVTPMYGCRPFARTVVVDGVESEPECPHNGPIPPGSRLYCEKCAASGLDGDPRLERDPRTDPKPEPRPLANPKRLSRRERRALKRASPWNQPPPTGSPRPS